MICQSHTLKLCLFHGTTVHKRNRIRLPSGISTYLYALPSACYFIYDFVTLVVHQFQGLNTWTANYVTMMNTPWTCRKNVSAEWECEYTVGM